MIGSFLLFNFICCWWWITLIKITTLLILVLLSCNTPTSKSARTIRRSVLLRCFWHCLLTSLRSDEKVRISGQRYINLYSPTMVARKNIQTYKYGEKQQKAKENTASKCRLHVTMLHAIIQYSTHDGEVPLLGILAVGRGIAHLQKNNLIHKAVLVQFTRATCI